MTFQQTVGVIALVIGAIDLFAYALLALGRPTPLLAKLGPMQARLGRVTGTLVHFAAYVLVPLVGGLIFLLSEN
jgi:hypothetical protein